METGSGSIQIVHLGDFDEGYKDYAYLQRLKMDSALTAQRLEEQERIVARNQERMARNEWTTEIPRLTHGLLCNQGEI